MITIHSELLKKPLKENRKDRPLCMPLNNQIINVWYFIHHSNVASQWIFWSILSIKKFIFQLNVCLVWETHSHIQLHTKDGRFTHLSCTACLSKIYSPVTTEYEHIIKKVEYVLVEFTTARNNSPPFSCQDLQLCHIQECFRAAYMHKYL